MRQVLLHDIRYVPQDPTTALDPLFTVRTQIAQVMPKAGGKVDDRIVALLAVVARLAATYPITG